MPRRLRQRSDRAWLGAEVAAAAALVGLQLVLCARLLHAAPNFDEDVYLAAVDALHHGQRLGEQVFAAQFPGFYDLLYGLTAVAGLKVTAARAALLAVFALGTAGAWLVGRRYGGRWGGALTAALFVVAPPLDLFAAQVLADPPSLALSIFAVGLATLPGGAAAVAAGAVLGAAISVKLTAITAIPAFLWFARDRLSRAAAGAAVVVALVLVLHLRALGDLWASGVTYHTRARDTPDVIPHPYRQILEQMPVRTPFVWLAVLAAVAGLAFFVKGRRTGVWPLWLWTALAWAFLLVQRPLHYNHLILLPGTLAVATGATLAAVLPRHRAVYAAVALVLVAAYVQQWRRVDTARSDEPPQEIAAARALARLTPPGALTIDDRPIVSFLARRRVVGPLVDLAKLRFETGSLDDERVIARLDEASAVVVSRELRNHPRILRAVGRSFRLRYDRGGVRIWVRR